jgi:hypothetical protein
LVLKEALDKMVIVGCIQLAFRHVFPACVSALTTY